MNIFSAIAIFGMMVAVLIYALVILYERHLRGRKLVPSLPGRHTLAQIGMSADPQFSLDTVIMRPSKGLYYMALGLGALSLWYIWGPMANTSAYNAMMNLGVTCVVVYAVLYIANYEARYDADGLTAPRLLFQQKHYDWADFISIGEDGPLTYKLMFSGTGKVYLQKYLVGMPTFLTFISDVKVMHQRT